MNGDAIWIYIVDNTAGCVPFTCTIYTTGETLDELKAETAAILADTGTDGVVVVAASKTGYSLTATTGLGNQTANITGDITGNLSGSIGSLAAQAKADVNAEVDTAISDSGIVTHLTDLKGATFNGATDSNEAIRNRGDSAWVTATGFSTLDAAGIRTAVGLAAANLDTQLEDLPTNAELAAATIARVTLVDTCTTNTDMRGTDSAALASVCTETRLSELDAGTAGKAAHQIDIIQTDTTTDIPALIAAAEAKIDTIDGIVDDILVDSGTTLDGKLDDLLEALVYKMIITEANGNTEMFNAASTSLGTIAAAFSSDGTYTTRKKMVI